MLWEIATEDCGVEACRPSECHVWLMQPEAHTTRRGFLAVARATFAIVITKRRLTNVLVLDFDSEKSALASLHR